MKKIFKLLFRLILVIIFISITTMGIDLVRVNNNKLPIFNTSIYDSKNSVQSFKGIIYTFQRKIKASINESLNDSSNLEFKVLGMNIKIKEHSNTIKNEYVFKYDNVECDKSSLYYADYNIKIYTYCINNIKVNNNDLLDLIKKDYKIINNIEDSLLYLGNNKAYMYTDNNIKLFKCNNGDYYIGSYDMEFNDDFCITKNDDFKYLAKIKEELPQGMVIEARDEVFYEDSEYLYKFNQVKSNYIYIVVDEVRGNPSRKYSLKEVLDSKLLTIDELEKIGLSFEREKKQS